jgi:hypothetical protein
MYKELKNFFNIKLSKHFKNMVLDPVSEIRDPRSGTRKKQIFDPGVQKGTGSQTRIRSIGSTRYLRYQVGTLC